MSHIIVRKIVEGQFSFAGRKWWYEFHALSNFFKEEGIKKYVTHLSTTYSKLTKTWNDELNSEWIVRIFMALKMVLSSSIMLESLEYAKKKNLRIVITYLEYYSILMALRAVIFTSPFTEWKEGNLIKLEHVKIINIVSNILSGLDKGFAQEIKDDVFHFKAYREWISYRAPSSGDSITKTKMSEDVIDICRILVELAQLQSEVLETSLEKNIKRNFLFKNEYIKQVCRAKIGGTIFWDNEDAYRMDYLRRKYPLPTNIYHMMSEGHVEDFFGSWCAKNKDGEDVFNPDENWRIIFDVP